MSETTPPMAGADANPVIAMQAEGLRVARGGRTVLQDLSLRLQAGTWTTLIGPNAAGKSTLMAALAGVQTTHSGEVMLAGRPLHAWSATERARQLAWLPQQTPGDIDLRVSDTVLLGRLPYLGAWRPLRQQATSLHHDDLVSGQRGIQVMFGAHHGGAL